MEDKFSGDMWDEVAPVARAARCRRLADEARKLASLHPGMNAEYLRLADGWDALARRIEEGAEEKS
jgi:hypothetical protein